MSNLNGFRSIALAAVALAGTLVPARAQDVDDQQRGVARISFMNGDVSVRRGDAGEWVAGVINAPLMTDDRISTAPNSRAEVQFDAANLVRLGGNAELRFTDLSDGRYQMELAHGTMTYVVLRPSSANVEVDTPSVSVRPSNRGVYRITVDDNGETQVISRAGEVEVFTPKGSEWVQTARMMMARGDPANPEYQIVSAPPLDEWDNWNQDRDQRMIQSTSYQYVPQGVYGAEDLDQYGSWNYAEPYGYVWRPTVVAADWAPYRSGRWVWEDWYGWTWVSYDPWGWAPYHYGRWFYDDGWCWYPGVLGRRHFWSPALVAWFGWGGGGWGGGGWGGGGVGFGFGNIGWVPLAPYETYHPWWGRGYYGRGFNQRINITNINVTNNYFNARHGGISGMGYNNFQSGRFNTISHFSGNQIGQAGLIRGQMPVAPGRSHLQFSDRAASFTPRESRNTRFFTQQRPASVQRVPFEQQRAAFTRSAPQFGNAGQVSPRGGNPALGNTRPSSARSNGGGWRTMGSDPGRGGSAPAASPRSNPGFQNTRPQTANGGRQAADPGAQGRGGWQRFGNPSAASGRQFGAMSRSDRPAPSESGAQNRGSWGRFGEPGASPRSNYQGGSSAPTPRYGAPGVVHERQNYSAPRSTPNYSAPRSEPRYSAPRSTPNYSAPRSEPRYSSPRSTPNYSAPRSEPRYSSPRSMPSYSAPRSAPSYSAPSRPSFGGGSPRGGGFSAPRSSGGGGGSRPSGGGGRSRR